jgi:hypothetical protein
MAALLKKESPDVELGYFNKPAFYGTLFYGTLCLSELHG